MEALGLVANIAAVIQLTAQVTQLSYTYFREVKNAPKIQKQYLQELSALMEVLFRCEIVIAETESTGLLPPRPASLDDEALMSCYKEISRLQYELQKRKSRILWPFQDKELKSYTETLRRFRENLSEYLSACVLVTSTATYQKVSSMSIEQSRDVLLTLIPAPEISIRARPDPCPGTGVWFLNQPELKLWTQGKTQLLWCYGPPGVGKSYLMSTTIDNLSKPGSSDILVTYFFCDFSSRTEHTTVDILRSLMRQVIERGCEDLLCVLKDLDETHAPPTAATITRMLAKAGSCQPIYLVLDGVDEMKDPTAILSSCLELADSGIQVLMASRKLPHIEKKMDTATPLEIRGNVEDMRLYIEKRLQESDLEDEMRQDNAIVQRVIAKSGGLLLLTRLSLDELLGLTTVGQIKKALKKEGLGLQQAFESTLQRIDEQSKARSFLARRLICWILYAKRRLSVDEILTAFSVDEEGIDPDNSPSLDVLLRICVGLVIVNKTDNTIGLIHTSAYEYLSTLIFPENPHLDIAQTCLRYLGGTMAHPCESSTQLLQRFADLKFLSYAAKHWGHHLCDRENQKRLQPLLMRLVNNEGLRHSSFQALQFRRELEGELADEIFESMPRGQHALHIAAYWNLVETVELLLEARADPSAADSHKWTALHWACANNHPQVASMLVLKGADVNAADIQGWTPLFWAAFIGNVELIRLLFSQGADHQFRSRLGWTALHWAISRGNYAAAKELLGHHSRLKRAIPRVHMMKMEQIKAYENMISPIELAADAQDVNLFELLLNDLEVRNGTLGDARFNCIWESARFDEPASENPWRTMTKHERAFGPESIVPNIANREDPDGENLRSSPMRWKSTLLVSAIRDGQLSSVQMLAKFDLGVNSDNQNALHISAHRQDPRFVECLLENGADPNRKDRQGRTALHVAIMNGFIETLAALVRGGSDVNQYLPDQRPFEIGDLPWRLSKKSNANQKAKARGTPPIMLAHDDLRMVHALLSHGADPDLTDSNGESALHQAFSFGDLRLINLLLESGACTNTTGVGGVAIPQPTMCRESTCSALQTGQEETPKASSSNMRNSAQSSEAIQGNDWSILNRFLSRPTKMQVALNLKPIMLEACRNFAADTLELLCRKDGGAQDSLILFLVKVYNSKKEKHATNTGILQDSLRRVLSILRFSGSLINFYGSAKEAGEPKTDLDLGFGFNFPVSSDRTTPLALAATLPDSRNTFNDLLGYGADLYHEIDLTFDPILTAALFGNEEDLSYLLEHSIASPNTSHWTNYIRGVQEHSSPVERVCYCLREAGILNRANVKGQTLLQLATQEKNRALMSALVAHGADENPQPQRNANKDVMGQPSLDLLYGDSQEKENSLGTAIGNGDIDAVSRFLEMGVDPSGTILEWIHDIPVLYKAAREGKLEVVNLLLKYGADTEGRDGYGWRPLHIACFRGYISIVKALISHGADVHAPTVKWNNDNEKPSGLYKDKPWTGTALHTATYGGNSEIVKILLEHKVDIHASTGVTEQHLAYPASGPTALHIALSIAQIPLMDLSRGTALYHHNVTSPGRLQIAQWLVDRGAMVYGTTQHFSLKQILLFAEFPNLWDKLVASDSKRK